MTALFDSHAHLLDERFDEDRDALIAEFAAAGGRVMECATDPDDMAAAAELAAKHAIVYAAVGVHPHSASEYTAETAMRIRELAQQEKVVAIGEIGLDYHYDFSPRDVQRRVLAEQLQIAKELNMPVSLHSREATEDMLAILAPFAPLTGVMHCFSGSAETAKILLDMGLHLGFGGSLTFKNNRKGVEVAAMVPMGRLLIETDSPYLAPVPRRGERNIPAFTSYVAAKLAEIKNVDEEAIRRAAWDNASLLFGIV